MQNSYIHHFIYNFSLGKYNILIIGAGDCRHILKTIAHTWRHSKKTLNVSLDGLVFKVYLFQVHLKWGLVERGGLIEDILYVSTGNICRRNIERLLCHRKITVLVFL